MDKQIRDNTTMIFQTYDRPIEGVVVKRLTYDLDLLVDGEKERLNKLPIKYMFKKRDGEEIKKGLEVDDALRDKKLEPIKPRKERMQIDTRQLGFARQHRLPIHVTLRGGEVFTGLIDWYSHYEIKMSLTEETSVVVFRHAAHHFELVGKPAPESQGGARDRQRRDRGAPRDRRPPRER